MKYPNPDIENTMLAQVLDMPRKPEKTLNTSEVDTFFFWFPMHISYLHYETHFYIGIWEIT